MIIQIRHWLNTAQQHGLFVHFNHVRLFATLWTVANKAPLSMGFPRQEYWSGLPFPPPGDLPDPGTEHTSSVSPALAGGFFTTEPPGKPKYGGHPQSFHQTGA